MRARAALSGGIQLVDDRDGDHVAPNARPQLRIADQYWLTAFDMIKNHPKIVEPEIGYTLAAALIVEALTQGDVRFMSIKPAHLKSNRLPPYHDSLRYMVARQIYETGGSVTVEDGLKLLARTSFYQVAERLVRLGIVERDDERRGWRETVTYSVRPHLRDSAEYPAMNLRTTVLDGRNPEPDVCLLGALVWAGSLSRNIFYGTAGVHQRLRSYCTSLRNDYRDVIEHAHVLIGVDLSAGGGHEK